MPLLDPVQGRHARRLSAAFAAVVLACLPAAAGPARAIGASISVDMKAAQDPVHVGDTARLNIVVTNSGAVVLHNVMVTNDVCAPTVFVGGDEGNDSLLGLTETWQFTCEFTVPAGGPEPIVGTATAVALDDVEALVSGSGTYAITVIHPQIFLEALASGDHVGDTVVYGFSVYNYGDTPLSGMSVSAAACVSAITGPDGDDGSDSILTGDMEVWQYSCNGPVVGASDSLFHVDATVTGHDSTGFAVEASAQAETTIIHPSGTLLPGTNPTTAHVGDTITFRVKVTNTGDSEFSSTIMTATECDGDGYVLPVLDPAADSGISPGEAWTYTCTHLVTESVGSTVHTLFHSASTDGGDRLIELSTTVDVAFVALGATPGPTPTKGTSPKPSKAPSAGPSVGPSDSPLPSPDPTVAPTAAPPATTTPPTGFSPAPTVEPVPTAGDGSGGVLPLIIAFIAVILIAGGGWFAWQRRRAAASPGSNDLSA